VLCMERVARIRRRRLVDSETISGSARELRVSRNTVKTNGEQIATHPRSFARDRQVLDPAALR
jgi:hypothetical protein